MLNKNQIFILVLFIVLGASICFPGTCLAESIDGSGPFDALLIAVLDVINSSILTAALVLSVVMLGIAIAIFPDNREILKRLIQVVIGLSIATKGSGFVADALGLSFLI